MARYSHVVLLNNDMQIEPGFFAALRCAFNRVPDLFCATAQIFFPGGQRREETGLSSGRQRPRRSNSPSIAPSPLPVKTAR